MNIKNVVSAALLPLTTIFLLLTFKAAVVHSMRDAPATSTTPPHLVPIGNLTGAQEHVTVQGHYAYLIDAERRITVVDIQTPTAPISVGVGSYTVCYSGPHCFPYFPAYGRLIISGTYLYVPLFNLQIVDVTNPAHPFEASRIYSDTQAQHYISAVALKGQYAYASGKDSIYTIDVSNPLSPTEVLSSSVPGDGYYMTLDGNYLYVSRSNGIHVLDVSNPISPTEIGSYPVGGGDIAVAGHYAYVSEGSSLYVLDVSNAAQITVTGRYTASSSIWSISVSEPYLHIIGGTGDLHTLNVSDPANPIAVAAYSGLQSNDLVVANGYIFTAGNNGLTIWRLVTHQVFLPLISK